MKRFLLPILCILVLVSTFWVTIGPEAADGGRAVAMSPGSTRAAIPPVRESPRSVSLEPAPTVSAAARTPVDGDESAPTEDALEPGAPAPTLCGRFLLPDGTPAVGVDLYVLGRAADPDRVRRFGLPFDWVTPTGETGVDGRFALRFDPPRAFAFELRGRLAGYANAWRRRSEIAPGETVDLGDVVLERPGSVEGAIVDVEGNALAQSGWLVHALADPPAEDLELLGHALPDRETGRFQIEGLPPRAVRLGAVGPMGERCEGPRVRVESGRKASRGGASSRRARGTRRG